MKARHRSRMKHLIVFFNLWLVTEAATRSFPFTRRFTDYYCAFTISYDFSEASVSSTHCVSACQNHPNCVGVFYSSGDSLCHGVDNYYGASTSGCEWRPGYAFYQSGSYGDMCDTNAHCSEYQTECKAGNCDCTIQYIRDGTTCRLSIYGDLCTSDLECAEYGTECRSLTCDCTAVMVRAGGVCRPGIYGDPCSSTLQCSESGTECRAGVCDCIIVNIRDQGVCRLRLAMDACTEPTQCPEFNHLTCTLDVCYCIAYYTLHEGACIPAWFCYSYTFEEQALIDLRKLTQPELDRDICEAKGFTFVNKDSLPGFCFDCYCCYTMV